MINYRILPEQCLIVVCIWGVASLEETMEFRQSLRGDPSFCVSYDTIVDNTYLESPYTQEEIHQLAKDRIETSEPLGKLAVVCSTDVAYGMSRMHEMVSESKNIHVFREWDRALEWLGRKDLDIQSVSEEIRAQGSPFGKKGP